MKTIIRDEIKQHLDKGDSIVLIEALPEKSFAEGHLPGALQLLPDQIKGKAAELIPNKEQLVVTYCANAVCQNSTRAAEILEELGYRNVVEYVEGKEDWIKAGFPVEKATSCCGTAKKASSGSGCCG